ncbi:MAG TPA: flavin reductase family protein [Acidimicrobiales bacterium]|nr:flavin reductase family protein [Acidimicrobiales bacterium]
MADHELVGPFPAGADPETYDRARRRILWTMPMGLYVLGSAAGGRRNLMTMNWATQVSTKPKLVAVSVEAGALTHRLVHDGGGFSLNILNRDDRAIVRKFVKPLEDGGDPHTLAGFEVASASTGSPILTQALAWLDCEVRHELPFDSHTLFVGEVVDCGGEPPDDAEILRMEDTRMSYGG